MSTLTKTLAVLLSVSAIFLCGAVFIYVSKTNDVKADYDQLKSDYKVLQDSKNVAVSSLNEQKMQMQQQIDKLKDKVSELNQQKEQAMLDLKNAQNKAVKWQDRVNSLSGIVKDFEQTISEMHASLESTRNMLQKEQEKTLKLSNMLNEKTTALDEHIVMVQSLKAEKRRLKEQMASMEKMFEQKEKAPQQAQAVTVVEDKAKALEPRSYAPVTGLVSEVGERLISVSVGSSDGVKKGMKLHITRGESFVCDIEITDVDVEKSAGVIKLKKSAPKVGDTVSTEL
ncbi:hypothetical protein [Sedimentisphaera salicampi]|uniref:Chromosome segregation protein SMC n=1 Tax=Sedimentisphaera salicampi TaxID=1941349 RepID=A0A1W6LP89_9BACT|nr:hypothetical protein [Sedimentisphaera salicampi]ARN57599.1 chromosome segregation protein SMC [Sedimentisphaera salicampi]